MTPFTSPQSLSFTHNGEARSKRQETRGKRQEEREETNGKGIAGIAGHVVRQHEDDVGIGDAETFARSIDTEGVGRMSIVEPKATRADEDGPVVCVSLFPLEEVLNQVF